MFFAFNNARPRHKRKGPVVGNFIIADLNSFLHILNDSKFCPVSIGKRKEKTCNLALGVLYYKTEVHFRRNYAKRFYPY